MSARPIIKQRNLTTFVYKSTKSTERDWAPLGALPVLTPADADVSCQSHMVQMYLKNFELSYLNMLKCTVIFAFYL